MEIKTNDAVTVDQNGFARIDTILASAGVLKYPDPNNKGEYLIGYMPEEELKDALDSFAGLALTNDHPKEQMVTPANYKKLSVGYVEKDQLRMEEGRVKGFAVVCSDEGIEAINGGKQDVSIGYSETKDFTPGVFVDVHDVMGEGAGKEFKYDFVKRNIKLNHLAICDEGRSKAAELIFDSEANYTYTTQETISLDSTDFIKTTIESESAQIMKENISNKMTELKSIVINGQIVEVAVDAADVVIGLAQENSNLTVSVDELKGENAALKEGKKKLEEDMLEYDKMSGELEALKALQKDAADTVTDSDVIANEAVSRLNAWKQVSSLSNDAVDFVPTNTALETKRAFIADNYSVDNVADASEAFLDGMLQVITKTSNKTVNKFVADSAPAAKKAANTITSSIATDAYDDGSFGISLG